MAGDWVNLRRRLAAATDLFGRTTDPIEKSFLGGDIREMERLVEITSAEPPDPLPHRRP
jgi:hypothetical protein